MQQDTEQQRDILSSLVGAMISSKTDRIVERLCRLADPESQLCDEPPVQHALRTMVAHDRFNEQTPASDVQQFVFAVRYISQVIEPVLDGERPRRLPAGMPSEGHQTFRRELLEELKTNPAYVELQKDPTFRVYINRMSNLLAVQRVAKDVVESNRFVRTRMLELLASEYLLFKDSELPRSLIKDCAHRRSVFEVQELYKKAREHPELGNVAKTAGRLVMSGSYDNLAAVAKQYRRIIKQVETMVVGTPELAGQATSIAGDVLSKIIPSVEYAKRRLLALRREASRLAQEEPKYESIIGSLVATAFTRKKWTIGDAKKVYDDAYCAIQKSATGESVGVLSPHGGALDILRGKYPSADEYISTCVEHHHEVNQCFPVTSPYYRLKGSIVNVLISGRFNSAGDVRTHLDSISAELDKKMEQHGYRFPQGTLRWALLRKRFPDVDTALHAYATCTVECHTRFQEAGIKSERYARAAAKYVFLRFYRNAEAALSALQGHIAGVREYMASSSVPNCTEEDLVVPLLTRRVKTIEESVRWVTEGSKGRFTKLGN